MKKYLAVAVILLFIGLAVAPSIHANVSKEALVEFTTEVCGLNGGKQSVKLTQEEAEEVEDLFESIREQLSATDTREEEEEVFKEAVIELDKYDLLGGLSVKQAQRLVSGGFQDSRIKKIFTRLFEDGKIVDNNSNFLCSIVGDISQYIVFQQPLCWIYLNLFVRMLFRLEKIVEWAKSHNLEIFSDIFYNFFGFLIDFAIFSYLYVFMFTVWNTVFNRIHFANVVGIGNYWEFFPSSGYKPAVGWINSYGSNGVKKWNGKLYGALPIMPIVMYIEAYYSGILGFTGLRINTYLIGSALWVKIGNKPP